MKSIGILACALAATAVAAPTSENPASDVAAKLQPGEYMLIKGDQQEVANETTLHEYLKAQGIALERPEVDQEWLNFKPDPEAMANLSAPALTPRQSSCRTTTSIVVDKTERFQDWDVQMSPVVLGAGKEGIRCSIESGWTTTNSVQVSAGLDWTFIKDKLGSSFGINYSRSWSSSGSTSYSTVIHRGEAGTWTITPWTNRRYGRTFRGCPGSLVQTGTFMADSHEDGSYEGHKWVSGYISACIKKAPGRGQALTRCHGRGTFK
ncbi:hypothetical protein MAPG_04848 [Magnaporthiopsis poae ATCC 64411]|uniref:Uncharacterized protein n=1 Tax=Magnaporthiopsis poae (strain ATCC 64411 / 73-15) TaxID=644358 RepID=A0A0C4DXU1_MAGP6|nr:hypothetical protein MAPG_04848 [Magnaporthiopsis poae ATCC 64411]